MEREKYENTRNSTKADGGHCHRLRIYVYQGVRKRQCHSENIGDCRRRQPKRLSFRGASIYYTPTIDTYKDDMEEITRKILSGEDIGIKGSIGTFMPDTLRHLWHPTRKFPQTVPTAVLIFILAALKTLRINTYAVDIRCCR